MELEDITKEFVLNEVAKLQYLYKLKTEIRYAQVRDDEGITESVAEHIYGMHILALYFLPLIDPERKLKRDRIYEMITLHDIDEIETGDMIGYKKSQVDIDNEAFAMRTVMSKVSQHMHQDMEFSISEYDEQVSLESKFVKAIDKFEPLVHIYSEHGLKIMKNNVTTATQSESVKEKYIINFPIMYKYYKVIHQTLIDEKYYSEV
jgi:5'-deoxynucleotidase YfbR-like HD superfamily hydrolase